jgi:hypothetical protein
MLCGPAGGYQSFGETYSPSSALKNLKYRIHLFLVFSQILCLLRRICLELRSDMLIYRMFLESASTRFFYESNLCYLF